MTTEESNLTSVLDYFKILNFNNGCKDLKDGQQS